MDVGSIWQRTTQTTSEHVFAEDLIDDVLESLDTMAFHRDR